MTKTKKRIIVGLSGGVDSSVSAYLLKKQGYEVIGLFMNNWDSYANNDILGNINSDKCNLAKDFDDALKVAKTLGIKLYKIEFVKKYWDKVFKYTIDEYKKGLTPNPDVLCNKYIKFDEFIKHAKKEFKTDQIAMGHYANVEYKNGKYYLKKAKDELKDQTYFLCWLNQQQLSKVIFPIGNLTKGEVREIAKKNKLNNWDKKDSTGICFIGEKKFIDFLNNYIKFKKGNIVDIETKKIIGKHKGVSFYTIGQNKNLNLSGQNDKYFVCKKDIKKNILYVVFNKNKEHFLSSTKCLVSSFNWINKPKKEMNVYVRFRHRQKLIPAKYQIDHNKNVILKYKKTAGVVEGQFAVLYNKKYCLGGGIIKKILN